MPKAKKAATSTGSLKVTQTGSASRRNEIQAICLKALGLGRIGKTRELVDNDSIRGLIRKVQHLVKVEG